MAVKAAGESAGQSKLHRLALTGQDFAALDFIGRRHGHRRSPAMRFVIDQQRFRDLAVGTWSSRPVMTRPPTSPQAIAAAEKLVSGKPDAAEYKAITWAARASVLSQSEEDKRYITEGVPLRQWSVRLYEYQSAAVDAISRAWDIPSRARAIRFAVRVQALLDGFEPRNGQWV